MKIHRQNNNEDHTVRCLHTFVYIAMVLLRQMQKNYTNPKDVDFKIFLKTCHLYGWPAMI